MTRVRAIAVEPIEREPLRRPVWSGGTLREPVAEVAPNRLQPLFPHATARALIGAAAHSVRQVGRVDLDAAVRIVAQRRPVHDIPRATARTMRAGIQLVIDRTWAMRPFFDDIAILRRQLSTVVGNDLVDELWFFGDLGACRRPHSIGRRSRAARDRTPRAERRAQTEAAWRPPEGEVPVIVVSDLGRADRMNGDPRVAKAWDELFRRAREAGCDVVSVVPRRINRDDCHDRTSSVAWDTRTTVGRVLAERKRARV